MTEPQEPIGIEIPVFTEDEYPEMYALLEEADREIEAGLAEQMPKPKPRNWSIK